MPITAQDFIDCIVVDFTAQPTLATEETKQAFDALLSRARQEAHEKAIDQCKDIVQGYIDSRPYFPLHSVQTRMEELKSQTN